VGDINNIDSIVAQCCGYGSYKMYSNNNCCNGRTV